MNNRRWTIHLGNSMSRERYKYKEGTLWITVDKFRMGKEGGFTSGESSAAPRTGGKSPGFRGQVAGAASGC
jgi:hypothetical protein